MKNFTLLTMSLVSLTLFAGNSGSSKTGKEAYGVADHGNQGVGFHATICGSRKIASDKKALIIQEGDSKSESDSHVLDTSSSQ